MAAYWRRTIALIHKPTRCCHSYCEKPPDKNFVLLTAVSHRFFSSVERDIMTSMRRWYTLPIRTRLGIVAVALLAVAALSVVQYFTDRQHARPLYGIIMWSPIIFLLWIAWPDLERIPRWVYYVAVPIAVVCALKPWLLLLVIPVALFALFVMPK